MRWGTKPPDPAAADVRAALPLGTAGVTVAVQGCAGGVGATTIAVVTATTVARRDPQRRVCVVSLDRNVGATWRVDPGQDAAQAPQSVAELGIHVLARSATAEADPPTEGVAPLVRSLSRRFDVVIVDCSASSPLLPPDLPVDRLLLVTTLAAPSLAGLGRRARDLRDRASVLGDAAPFVRVVVNGALNEVGVDPSDVVATALGAPIVAAVPSAVRDVVIATNAGRLDRLLHHPDLGPVYRSVADFCVPRAPGQTVLPQRRRRRRWRRERLAVQLPVVREHADGRDVG